MSTLWTKQEDELLSLVLSKPVDYIYNQFRKRFDNKEEGFFSCRSMESITRKLRRLREQEGLDELQTGTDYRWDKLEELYESYKLEEEPAYLPYDGNDRIILSLSDLHLPFTPIDNIKVILEAHKKELRNKESCIVLNGDIMDEYAASNFGKYRKIAIIDEYRMALNLVDLCLDYADSVFMTRGNHEKRLGRMVRDVLSDETATVFGVDLLARIANGEEIDDYGISTGFRKKFKGKVFYQRNEPWYIRIGKTVFAHPSAWKSGPGATVEAVSDYMASRYGPDDFDSVIIGHTHKISKMILGNKMLIEQGALCGRLDYEHQDNLKFKHAQRGYALIYQCKDGTTNFNESKVVYLGSMLPKKKKIIF